MALIAAYWQQYWFDPVVALAIAGVLFYSVYGIVKEALQVLMDQAMPDEDEAELKALINSCEGVRGFHDLRTRQAGALQFIQFHLELDALQPLKSAHAIGDRVEKRILERFPRAEIIIHHDPV